MNTTSMRTSIIKYDIQNYKETIKRAEERRDKAQKTIDTYTGYLNKKKEELDKILYRLGRKKNARHKPSQD